MLRVRWPGRPTRPVSRSAGAVRVHCGVAIATIDRAPWIGLERNRGCRSASGAFDFVPFASLAGMAATRSLPVWRALLQRSARRARFRLAARSIDRRSAGRCAGRPVRVECRRNRADAIAQLASPVAFGSRIVIPAIAIDLGFDRYRILAIAIGFGSVSPRAVRFVAPIAILLGDALALQRFEWKHLTVPRWGFRFGAVGPRRPAPALSMYCGRTLDR